MPIIRVEKISKSFDAKIILDNISFEIEQGSFTTLLGRNGSGKSTLINLLVGLENLDSGEYFVLGENIRNDPYQIKNQIAHISEKTSFNYPQKMGDFIGEYSKFFTNYDLSLFYSMAKDLDISLEKCFNEYSRGQKMQLALISALSYHPKILFIDEITSVLDAYARNYFIPMLKDFTCKGGTVILATNIVSEVQHFCSEVLFLNDGQVKFHTAIDTLPNTVTKIKTLPGESLDLSQMKGVLVSMNSDGSHSYLIDNKILNEFQNVKIDRRKVTLEDLYVFYTRPDQE